MATALRFVQLNHIMLFLPAARIASSFFWTRQLRARRPKPRPILFGLQRRSTVFKTCSRSGRPATGCSTFGSADFIRVPCLAAGQYSKRIARRFHGFFMSVTHRCFGLIGLPLHIANFKNEVRVPSTHPDLPRRPARKFGPLDFITTWPGFGRAATFKCTYRLLRPSGCRIITNRCCSVLKAIRAACIHL